MRNLTSHGYPSMERKRPGILYYLYIGKRNKDFIDINREIRVSLECIEYSGKSILIY